MTTAASFINDLEKVAQARAQVAASLGRVAATLQAAELDGKSASGSLGLTREIADITAASKSLQEGVFRLLVLGDMKRGKSTFLNALIGENILPSDVNPCTAILTVLRFGREKKVAVYFYNRKLPEYLDFQDFKRRYTIDPSEAKKLEQEKRQAFPDVSHAVVEYPLPLLEKGVEIVDSPGLNDTEARNELSLGYINNCHAILFVLRASQPCTLGERRYLENYIKGRGLTVFFLINAWDQIKESLIDPDDEEELREAEDKLRRVFKANLAEYCQLEGGDIYDERVFTISAIKALRKRLKNPLDALDGTGFPEFMRSLNIFLTQERGVAEIRQARTLARQIGDRIREAVELRIPLLDRDVIELKRCISSVEPEFQKLIDIGNQFQAEIRQTRDTKAKAVADSFRAYILNLGNTFESDFLQYQPELKLFDFFDGEKRENFNAALQKAFEQYVNDKLAEWSRTSAQYMDAAFLQLSRSAANYGASYSQVTDSINEKISGQKLPMGVSSSESDRSPGWAKWAMGLFALSAGNLAGVALAGAGFDWKNILLNYFTVLGISGIIATISGIALGPIGIALLGLGIGVFQADQARREVVKVARQELVKHLPRIASEQWQVIYDAVKECFDSYEQQVTQRIDDDIAARKAELDNLLKQKESYEINRELEVKRLQTLQSTVGEEVHQIELAYDRLLEISG